MKKSRLTVCEYISYQPFDREPDNVSDQPFCRIIDTDEQLWKRVGLCVTNEWQEVPLGWVERCAHLIVRNDEGRFTQVQPTLEERSKVLARTVELAVEGVIYAEVPVLESQRITPRGKHFIRCVTDEAKVTIIAVPG